MLSSEFSKFKNSALSSLPAIFIELTIEMGWVTLLLLFLWVGITFELSWESISLRLRWWFGQLTFGIDWWSLVRLRESKFTFRCVDESGNRWLADDACWLTQNLLLDKKRCKDGNVWKSKLWFWDWSSSSIGEFVTKLACLSVE